MNEGQELLTEHEMALEQARKKLDDRQAAYAEIVAYTGLTASARKEAGFGRTPTWALSKMWLSGNVKEYIRLLNEGVDDDVLVSSRKERMMFLSRIIRGEETEEVVTKMGVVTVEANINHKMKAAEMLAKMLGEMDPQQRDDSRSITLSLPDDLQKIFAQMPASPMALLGDDEDED